MNKTNQYTACLFLLAAITFGACDQQEPGKTENPVPVNFSASISVGQEQTRTVGDEWADGDEIGICMLPAGQGISTDADVKQYMVSASGMGTSLSPENSDHTLYYPTDNSKVTFTAFYPYAALNTGTTNVTYRAFIDQSTPAAVGAVDALYHKATTEYDKNTAGSVPLTFKHLFSKLRITIQTPVQDDGAPVDTTGIQLSVNNLPGAAMIDLSEGTVTADIDNRTSTVFCHYPKTGVFEAIVVPHKADGDKKRTITLSTGFTYELPDSDFEGGNLYTLTLKLTRKGLEVVDDFSEISSWEEGSTTWKTDYIDIGKSQFSYLFAPFTANKTLNLSFVTNCSDVRLSCDKSWVTLPGSLSPMNDAGLFTYNFNMEISAMDRGSSETATIKVLKPDGVTVLDTYTINGVCRSTDNCYMLQSGATVDIPVIRANEFTGIYGLVDAIGESTAFTAEILWTDPSGLISTPTVVGNGYSGYIRVKATSGKVGNAVVAVKVGGEIVWSWHIWVSNYTGSTTWANNGFTFMDRNLGATVATLSLAGRGLFYQWGRKDPLPGGKEGMPGYAALGSFSGMNDAGSTTEVIVGNYLSVVNAIKVIIRNPMAYYSTVYSPTGGQNWMYNIDNTLWNTPDGRKTIYDPCPLGWRVPVFKDGTVSNKAEANSPWYGMSAKNWPYVDDVSGVDDGGADWGTNAIYPAAGMRTNLVGGEYGRYTKGGASGMYWSASVSGNYGLFMSIYPNGLNLVHGYERYMGISVRCVKE